jgi:hypothetical protein
MESRASLLADLLCYVLVCLCGCLIASCCDYNIEPGCVGRSSIIGLVFPIGSHPYQSYSFKSRKILTVRQMNI